MLAQKLARQKNSDLATNPESVTVEPVLKDKVTRESIVASAAAKDQEQVDVALSKLKPKLEEMTLGEFRDSIEEITGKDIDKLRAVQKWADDISAAVQEEIKKALDIETDGRVGFKTSIVCKETKEKESQETENENSQKCYTYLVAQWRKKDKVRTKIVRNVSEAIVISQGSAKAMSK